MRTFSSAYKKKEVTKILLPPLSNKVEKFCSRLLFKKRGKFSAHAQLSKKVMAWVSSQAIGARISLRPPLPPKKNSMLFFLILVNTNLRRCHKRLSDVVTSTNQVKRSKSELSRKLATIPWDYRYRKSVSIRKIYSCVIRNSVENS